MSDDHRYKLIFEELMDKSEDGFIVIDSHGIITDINDKYCDFLGRKKENILGHPIEKIISTTSMYDVMNRRQRGDDAGTCTPMSEVKQKNPATPMPSPTASVFLMRMNSSSVPWPR